MENMARVFFSHDDLPLFLSSSLKHPLMCIMHMFSHFGYSSHQACYSYLLIVYLLTVCGPFCEKRFSSAQLIKSVHKLLPCSNRLYEYGLLV